MLSGTARDGERPATFRDVLAIGEFRAIYAASTLSWIGDYIARAAITALVYEVTESVVASAAAFAISFTPWLLGGPVLASLAERYPYRRVMVLCDAVRVLVMCLVALPRLPLPAVLVLLLISALFGPPFEAARSATLPAVLTPDRYVLGLALHTSTAQPMQVAGYFLGAALAGVIDPRLALLLNAGTFATSAILLRFGTRLREPGLSRARRTHLMRETIEGFQVVFSNSALRSIVLLVVCASMFAVVPEGLGAVWAGYVADDADRGIAQGTIMAAVPFGCILGALSVARLAAPATRRKLLRPLAVATPLVLVPAAFDPPLVVVAVLAASCGFLIGAAVPIANGQFVQALPNAYRARAFGVVQGGLQVVQGAAVLVTGALATMKPVPLVVGLWSLGGVVLMAALAFTWPSDHVYARAVRDAAEANEAASRADAEARPLNGAHVPAARRWTLRSPKPAPPH